MGGGGGGRTGLGWEDCFTLHLGSDPHHGQINVLRRWHLGLPRFAPVNVLAAYFLICV